jgi:hypothetical protein
MRTPRLAFALPFTLLGLAGVSISTSFASVPNAAQSTIPACLAACPIGDLPYTVVIRDVAGNPVSSPDVVLDFSACPNIRFCPPGPPPAYIFITPTSIRLTGDAQGRATFYLEVGGTCASAVQVLANAVLMTDGVNHSPVSVANTDQDGDLFVLSNDGGALAAKGPTDPTADLNCDGVHDAADATLLSAHLGHFCRGFIDPVLPRTWGQLKILYR